MEKEQAENEPNRKIEYWIARIFNNAVLGAVALIAIHSLYIGDYLTSLILFATIPLLFKLKDIFNAP